MTDEKKTSGAEPVTEHGPKPTITPLDGIRAAVEKHHGGHENTDDRGIMLIWDGLDNATQKRYQDNTEIV